jgi:hypothetical protein
MDTQTGLAPGRSAPCWWSCDPQAFLASIWRRVAAIFRPSHGKTQMHTRKILLFSVSVSRSLSLSLCIRKWCVLHMLGTFCDCISLDHPHVEVHNALAPKVYTSILHTQIVYADDPGFPDTYGRALSDENGLTEVVKGRLSDFGSFWESGETTSYCVWKRKKVKWYMANCLKVNLFCFMWEGSQPWHLTCERVCCPLHHGTFICLHGSIRSTHIFHARNHDVPATCISAWLQLTHELCRAWRYLVWSWSCRPLPALAVRIPERGTMCIMFAASYKYASAVYQGCQNLVVVLQEMYALPQQNLGRHLHACAMKLWSSMHGQARSARATGMHMSQRAHALTRIHSQAYANMVSDSRFVCPAKRIAGLAANAMDKPVFFGVNTLRLR